MMKRKTTGSKIPMAIAIGVIACLAISFGCTALVASLILNGAMGESLINAAVTGVYFLSAFAGSILAAVIAKEKRLLVCLLSGAIYLACVVSVNAMFFEGIYSGVLWGIVASLAGAFCAGLLGMFTKQGRGKRIKKYRFV